ncbi:hypothetical protein [Gilliamella apicola]|uniref:hypothetical protein n=1 Tax=Gilliamella sp. Occ4-3 TaxID=3120254 RepID=UPI00080E1C5B|nr:hypothetical protein A9G44_02595 [Gilliamella apicola]
MTPSTLDRWITQASQSGSFKTKDIRFDLQKEDIWVSRRYIFRVMKALLLVSKYTVRRYQSYKCVAIPSFCYKN